MRFYYTFLIETPTGIYCDKCGSVHTVVESPDKLPLKSVPKVIEESWRPITLECTCGARCTILNGHICE